MAKQDKPNIVVIFGDDIGMWNVGLYTHGMMGWTPSIDRIGREGVLFTDHYGQPSCTAGRAAFIMGQMPVRTGMTTIGIPGSPRGIQKSDPSWRRCSSRSAMPPASSARTISVTATSSCPRCTASTSGSATSIT
jgi:arylsulfatase A-like enzyme